jgi:hypothetical protein
MNERIKELAIKADLYVDVNGNPWPRNMNGEDIEGAYQKFAELIVAEAVAVVQRRFMGDLNREDLEVRRCVEDLKLHFGVEE